jgi:hypothetical protein
MTQRDPFTSPSNVNVPSAVEHGLRELALPADFVEDARAFTRSALQRHANFKPGDPVFCAIDQRQIVGSAGGGCRRRKQRAQSDASLGLAPASNP